MGWEIVCERQCDVCEREDVRVCVSGSYVRERERECVCVCVYVRERETERVCVCV